MIIELGKILSVSSRIESICVETTLLRNWLKSVVCVKAILLKQASTNTKMKVISLRNTTFELTNNV